MKFVAYLLLFYLTLLTALPSVRAVKMQFGNNCEMSIANAKQNECEKGKFVSALNFSALQFVGELQYSIKSNFFNFDAKPSKSFYDSFFVSNYQNSIWHPPKV